MKWLKFNLNDHIKVKLTPRGLELHRKAHDDLCEKIRSIGGDPTFEYIPPKVDRYGWTSFQLWYFMQMFGEHIFNGCKPPCETTIKLELKESR